MRPYRTYPFAKRVTRRASALDAARRTGRATSTRASANARALLFLALALLAVAPAAALAVTAADRIDPSPPAVVTTATQDGVAVTLGQRSPSVSHDATLSAMVVVTDQRTGPLSYLEVRLQLRTPGGRLLYQRTQFRNDATGTVSFDFARSLQGLTDSTPEGRYRLQARVFTTGADPIQLEDRVLVVDPTRAPVPLIVVTRLAGAPMTDPAGRFVVDPGVDTATRNAAVALTSAVASSKRARVSLQAPPYMLDDWLRASDGFTVVTSTGNVNVAAGSPVPTSYGAALKALRGLLLGSRTELLDVPYADPDLPALADIGAMRDLPEQYARSLSTYRATLDASPSAGTAALCTLFPESSLPVLVKRSIGYAIIATGCIATPDTTASAVHLHGSHVIGLIPDPAASAALASATPDVEGLLDALFARRSAEGTPEPVVAVVPLGEGSPVDPAALTAAVDMAASSGWVRPMTAGQAASLGATRTVQLAKDVEETGTPPAGYWASVSEARNYSTAFIGSVGPADPDARAAVTQAIMSESRAWAGPQDGTWLLAPRGRAFSSAATSAARSVFDKVSLQVSNVTLSGSSGRVPVTVRNASDKQLELRLTATSPALAFPKGASQTVRAHPGESFVTVPVDLGQAISGRMTVAASSGQIQLATASLSVTASFIDRLAIVGAIIVVLIVLLVVVRSRVRRFPASGKEEAVDRGGGTSDSPPDGEEEA